MSEVTGAGDAPNEDAMSGDELTFLDEAISKQKSKLESWSKPAEPLLFETLRAIDALMLELFERDRSALPHHIMSSWGVNKALERMIPPALKHETFRLFPSTRATQAKADEFLLHCGILQRAELLRGWLQEGLVSARLDKLDRPLKSGITNILVLKTAHPSLFSEIVSHKHRQWMADLTVARDRAWERNVEERHLAIESELEKHVGRFGSWGMRFSSTREIDEHFVECGQIYLRRMWSQDLLGPDDKIGGSEFKDFLGVLVALSGRAQKHLCFASLLRRRHPELDFRNLLTTFAPCDDFLTSLSAHLDADTLHVQKLLSSFTLEPQNVATHTASGETVWAPIVRSSNDHYVLPQYGLDINPFLFLLRDLQAKYPDDWFRAANNREKRWLADLVHIFPRPRWKIRDRNLNLREHGATVTDLNFIAYDTENNELGLFQLKWQQPAWTDNRARRSAGKNLVTEANKWAKSVQAWLEKHGVGELANRASIAIKPDVRVEFFVIGRYNAFFSGFSNRDESATWADWNNLLKARLENPQATLRELSAALVAEAAEITTSYEGESYMVPVGDLAVILNPSKEPLHGAQSIGVI